MNKTYWKIVFTSESLIMLIMILCILNKAGINLLNGKIVNIACAYDLSSDNPCSDSEEESITSDSNKPIIETEDTIKADKVEAAMFHQEEDNTETEESKDVNNVKSVKEKYKDQIKRSYKTNITSYNSEAEQTDDSPCITASGLDVCERNTEDIVATNDLPLHSKILIPEYFGERIFYVEDRMNVRYTGTGRVDIWMKDETNSRKWGIKYTEILVLKD